MIVEEWQFACCGVPFAVGDLVHWRLSFTEGGSLPEALVTVDVVVDERLDTELHGSGTLLTVQGGAADGVTVYGPPLPAGDAVRLTGRFAEDHHELVPASVPLTTGRITRAREATPRLRDVRGFTDRSSEPADLALFLVDLQVIGAGPPAGPGRTARPRPR